MEENCATCHKFSRIGNSDFLPCGQTNANGIKTEKGYFEIRRNLKLFIWDKNYIICIKNRWFITYIA